MAYQVFEDRRDAGRRLAEELAHDPPPDPVVLALPRGGVPVAFEVAQALGAPLDVLVVRKLGAPFQPELALGAIGPGNVRVMNEAATRLFALDPEMIEEIAARELAELERRERLYRGDRAAVAIENRNVILVDDGLATGASMRAAVEVARRANPASVVVAVPTGSVDSVRALERVADRVVCLETPDEFWAVGQFYRHFDQTSDEEVRRLLNP